MANKPLHVAPTPCTTCPYRRDTPPGIWHPEEYQKLPLYDGGGGMPYLATFHCHQEGEIGRPTVCRGWLSVHANSPAVRMACFSGLISKEDMATIPYEAEPGLYADGAEACRAGMRGVRRPGKRARQAIGKLKRRKARAK